MGRPERTRGSGRRASPAVARADEGGRSGDAHPARAPGRPGPDPRCRRGGGWAARMMRGARVVAIDIAADMADSPLAVRGDMRKLPLGDGIADGALYAASLHYAPLHVALGEAARVL